jgi:hypothetical protein
MHSSQRSTRRRSQLRPCPEALEARSLLTGGAGNTFAILPETITNPGGSMTVNFTLNPAQFTLPKGKFVLGIDVAPMQNSNVQPLIKQVNTPQNTLIPQAIHTIYNPHLSHAAVARGTGTRAVLVPITLSPQQGNKPVTYSLVIDALSKTSGKFLLGFYLPGDANGDGVVDQTDIAAIKASLHSKSGDSKYNFDADANRDRRIGSIDLAHAQQNLGVRTTITPVVTANLDPATDTGTPARTTTIQDVRFKGQGTPGATITYSEINHHTPDVSTTVDTTGNYSVIVPLGPGMNTFKVTSVDGFGQTISGQISPVNYTPNPGVPVPNGGLPVPTTNPTTTTHSNSTSTIQ